MGGAVGWVCEGGLVAFHVIGAASPATQPPCSGRRHSRISRLLEELYCPGNGFCLAQTLESWAAATHGAVSSLASPTICTAPPLSCATGARRAPDTGGHWRLGHAPLHGLP